MKLTHKKIMLYYEVVGKVLAHLTFIDVKKIMNKQECCKHVPTEAARAATSLECLNEKSTKNKKVSTPAVDTSVRLTRTLVDFNLQNSLLTLKYNVIPITNTVRSKIKSIITCTKKIFTDTPSVRKIIEQYPLMVVKAVLVTAKSYGMSINVYTVVIKMINDTYLHINIPSNLGPSDFSL